MVQHVSIIVFYNETSSSNTSTSPTIAQLRGITPTDKNQPPDKDINSAYC